MRRDRIEKVGSDRAVTIKHVGGESFGGILASVGDRWTLIHLVWDLELRGLTALHTRDIVSMKTDGRHSSVIVRSLQDRGIYPTPLLQVDLNTTTSTLDALSKINPFLTVHEDGEACHLGKVASMDADRKRLEFHEINPAAVWDDHTTTWRFRNIRRVDVNDPYAIAIERLAGPPPIPLR